MTAPERLAVLLGALDEALADLEQYARDVPFDRLVTDRGAFRMVCHALYVAAQSCIDIAELIAAARGLGPAPSYRESFLVLGRAGLVPADLTVRMAGWAGLRNVLAHVYTRLDLELVHKAYAEELDSLRDFRRLAPSLLE
jgi:uncharacterized protein YutE (UPF0331/DUF86 family)